MLTTLLLSLWGALTVALIILLIYRSTLAMHEDDQLFLDDAQAHMAEEQRENTVRMHKVDPWVRICGAGSATLIVIIAGLELYSHLS